MCVMAGFPGSIVEYCGWREGGRCGYCGSPDLKCSHGMWAHYLNVQDYQDLIDRGWRRSGKYIYKPTMNLTCCPQYPIRCKVQEFKLRKSHKKVIKCVNNYLNTGKIPEKVTNINIDSNLNETDIENNEFVHIENNCPPSRTLTIPTNPVLSNSIDFSVNNTVLNQQKTGHDSDNAVQLSTMELSFTEDSKPIKPCRTGSGPDPNKPKCIKKKILRKEKYLQKQNSSQQYQINTKNLPKTLETLLNEIIPQSALLFEIRLVRSCPQSQQFRDTFDKSFHLYKKYQMEIHKDPEHKITSQQFTRFLIDSPLQEDHDTNFEPGYGSFHQQYWIGDDLIAVGVIDILPQGISSVYFYYDPSYHFLSLGTYSALREIAFTQHITSFDPEINWYYMGFYIHSCPKMRYKGQYTPSFLNCPETYKWYLIDECIQKLDDCKYSRFAPSYEEDDQDVKNISNVSILFKKNILTYRRYSSINKNISDADEVMQYAKLVGSKVSESLLLVRS